MNNSNEYDFVQHPCLFIAVVGMIGCGKELFDLCHELWRIRIAASHDLIVLADCIPRNAAENTLTQVV